MSFFCDSTYKTGYRTGEDCTHPATVIVNTTQGAPIRVCGYHARAYVPRIVYPLNWSLARIRQWQMVALDTLLGSR